MRNIKNTSVPANGVMLFFLRTVMQRHIPAAKIDDASTGINVFFV
jgi:hypothetical protein